ncbi:MAG: hypothetical protein KC422_26015 [Trueperaceae bacterium]|nr:hypothetical protein [Trueperaceae bacterium]
MNAEHLRGLTFTIVITNVFAALWGFSGSMALFGLLRMLMISVVVMVTAIWFGIAYSFLKRAKSAPKTSSQMKNPFGTLSYRLAVIAQFIAIPVVARILTTSGHAEAIISAVAMIVGLHFFGLIPAFKSWQFAAVGTAMVALAVLSLALPVYINLPSGLSLNLRQMLIGFGSAFILWLSIIPTVLKSYRERLRIVG